jgi:hypothetical protein
MTGLFELSIRVLAIGIGATMAMDLWALVAARLFGFQRPNYAMVGRWIGHMPRGRFAHDKIAQSASIPGERILGWTAHYVVGIAFAALLIGVAGSEWMLHPTLLPAVGIGMVTLLAPFFLMQPGMGHGIASCRMANPNAARVKSLLTHIVFGLGLYCSAYISNAVLRA